MSSPLYKQIARLLKRAGSPERASAVLTVVDDAPDRPAMLAWLRAKCPTIWAPYPWGPSGPFDPYFAPHWISAMAALGMLAKYGIAESAARLTTPGLFGQRGPIAANAQARVIEHWRNVQRNGSRR